MKHTHDELLELQLKQAKSKEMVQKVQGLLIIGLIIWIAVAVIF